MKHLLTLSFLILSVTVFSQQKNEVTKSTITEQKKEDVNLQKPAGTVKYVTSETTPLPYDVNDKYMGRAAEFIGNLTVSELPADFPVYEKQSDLKTYNKTVTAFYYSHMNIVKESVRKKLELIQH